jgi:hypothetical protein
VFEPISIRISVNFTETASSAYLPDTRFKYQPLFSEHNCLKSKNFDKGQRGYPILKSGEVSLSFHTEPYFRLRPREDRAPKGRYIPAQGGGDWRKLLLAVSPEPWVTAP